jgi:CBS domain containing-hemolysin-like protein
MALVVNEFGEIEGLATLEDLVEEIVGENPRLSTTARKRGPVERLPDGSMVIAGSALLKDLKADFELPFEESPDYHTAAGLLLARLKRIPRGGEWIEENGFKLTIVDMEGRRIVKIKSSAIRQRKRGNGGLQCFSNSGSQPHCHRDRESKPKLPVRARPSAKSDPREWQFDLP